MDNHTAPFSGYRLQDIGWERKPKTLDYLRSEICKMEQIRATAKVNSEAYHHATDRLIDLRKQISTGHYTV